MKIFFVGFLFWLSANSSVGQTSTLRSLSSLIDTNKLGWKLTKEWIKNAKNPVKILAKDPLRADSALLMAQVSTKSPMGAIIYETGGILVDNGWIRILGSGNIKLDRDLMDWNKGKSFMNIGEKPSFLLIADDVVGGFFAINAGKFGNEDIGKVFYLSPDNLEWEPMGLGYSEFLVFCFSGNLEEFYKNLRWENWKKDIQNLDGNSGISCFPFLFTKEGSNINKDKRTPIPTQQLWKLIISQKNSMEEKK